MAEGRTEEGVAEGHRVPCSAEGGGVLPEAAAILPEEHLLVVERPTGEAEVVGAGIQECPPLPGVADSGAVVEVDVHLTTNCLHVLDSNQSRNDVCVNSWNPC